MEPEPLRTDDPRGGTPLLEYGNPPPDPAHVRPGVGVLGRYLFALGFGVLLTYGLVAGAVNALAGGGGPGVRLWGYFVLGPVAAVFVWAGIVGLRYWFLQPLRRPLRPTSSPVIHAVRTLFHRSWGG